MATAALLRDPRAVKLSNQLRGQAAALAQRNITSIPPAYIDEVADQLLAFGIDDLKAITGTVTVEYGPNPYQIGMFGTEAEPYIQYGDYPVTRLYIHGVEWPITIGEKVAWNHDGSLDPFPVGVTYDGKFYIVVKWIDPPGAPIVLLIQKKPGRSPWQGVVFIAGFVATAMGLPAIIGEAVLGAELAATYPAAANAVGTVATRTVLTGGDVESAVRSAATGFVGAEFGDFAGQVVDSPAIGAAAGAATTAALSGGDPRAAALQAFLKQGAKVSELFPGDPTEYDPTEYLYLPGDDVGQLPGGDFTDLGDISLDDLGLSIDLDSILSNLELPEALTIPLDAIIPDDAGNLFTVDGHFVEMSADQYLASLYPDEQGNIRGPDNSVILENTETIKYLDDPTGLADALRQKIEPLQGGTTIAPLTVPNLRPINIPPPAGQTKTPIIDWAKTADQLLKTAVSIGGSIKAIANGTFRPQYGTSPYGTARPPVGVPVRQADGSTVVNNGNGTQTIRYPDGRVQTMPTTYTSTGMAGNYGQSFIPGVPNTALLIGGGLVLAALLLSRR